MKNKFGCVYKIENIQNGKIYIGQTSLKNPIDRWKDHYTEYLYQNTKNYNLLYSEMRSIGIDKFVFQIIEINIPILQLDDREKYYIELYKTNINGYNISLGGQCKNKSQKLLESDVRDIIALIRQNLSFKDISKLYNVGVSTISDINCGDTWKFEDEVYPIILSYNIKKGFSDYDIDRIYFYLRNGYSYRKIANIYNTSSTTISNINYGKIYARNDVKYPIMRKSMVYSGT